MMVRRALLLEWRVVVMVVVIVIVVEMDLLQFSSELPTSLPRKIIPSRFIGVCTRCVKPKACILSGRRDLRIYRNLLS